MATWRSDVKHALLGAAGMRRIHIVGCSRSGTSMLCYAHSAFRGTVLFDDEVSAWNHPSLRDALGYVGRFAWRPRRRTLVTKRGEYWYRSETIDRLVRYVRRHGIFVLLIVRDPLDVMTSHLSLHERRFFVQPKVWARSADAGEALMAALADHPRKLLLRYEDVVREPIAAQERLMAASGLRLAPGIDSWGTLASNVARRGRMLRTMIPFMHRLRDFDTRSIGRWQTDPDRRTFVLGTLTRAPQRERILAFMRQHRYPLEAFGAAS